MKPYINPYMKHISTSYIIHFDGSGAFQVAVHFGLPSEFTPEQLGAPGQLGDADGNVDYVTAQTIHSYCYICIYIYIHIYNCIDIVDIYICINYMI